VSRRVASIAIIVAGLVPFLAADSTAADAPGLYITFRSGAQRITVTLANGTPVGTTSGPPTVIAPGLYNLFMDDSAGIEGPELDLRGPGVNFVDSMFYGENPSETFTVTFEPSSTYTWRNNEQPSVVFTFVTSSSGGASSAGGAGGTGSSTSKTGRPSVDIVGSDIVPFRGALDAIVYKSGALSLTRNGKKVTFLKTGRYTFSTTSRASTGSAFRC
jgi:hypothetical protein